MARTLFSFVVMDLDRTFAAEQLAALVQADLLLLTFRLDMASLQNARRVLNRLDEIGIEVDRIRLVVSQHRQPKELPTKNAEQALGMGVFHCVPYDPASVNSSINKGTPVVIDRPRSKAAKSFCELADRLCQLQEQTLGREFVRNEAIITVKAAQLL